MKSKTLTKGTSIFSSLKIYAKPDSEVFFKVIASDITRYYGEFFDLNNHYISDSNVSNTYSYIFSIRFRECVVGEIYIEQINRYYIYN